MKKAADAVYRYDVILKTAHLVLFTTWVVQLSPLG
jgi:hypothetical protein